MRWRGGSPATASATSSVVDAPPRSGVRGPSSSTCRVALSMRVGGGGLAELAQQHARRSGSSRRGSPGRVPAMSGAVPWIGSKRPGPPSPSEADGARPMPPETEAARSERMSPNRFSVTITSYAVGCSISFIVIESTSWCSSCDVGVVGRHLVGDVAPEPRRVEHVRLVDARQPAAPGPREPEALADDPADLLDAVAAGVERAVGVAARARRSRGRRSARARSAGRGPRRARGAAG